MSVFTNSASRSADQAGEYTAAILDLLGSADPMTVLRRTEPALREIVAACSLAQLSRPEAPGKWSMRQVLQHLADSELVWGYRLRMMLAHERPSITGYDQDLWAERLRYDEADPADAIAEFGTLRRSNLRLLERATPSDMARVYVHAERGEERVDHLVKLYAGHDLLHLRQLDRIHVGS